MATCPNPPITARTIIAKKIEIVIRILFAELKRLMPLAKSNANPKPPLRKLSMKIKPGRRRENSDIKINTRTLFIYRIHACLKREMGPDKEVLCVACG